MEARERDAPWREDPLYGGMSEEAAERSWRAEQVAKASREAAAARSNGDQARAVIDDRPPVVSAAEFDLPDEFVGANSEAPQLVPAIRLVPFEEIRLTTQRRYLVKGIIPRVGLSVAWGPPKCGKSFWAFDVSMHVALDWEYRGRRVHAGPVVYCAFEGQTGIEARVAAFRERFLQKHRGAIPFYLEPVTLDLVRDHKNLIASIRRQLGDGPPVLVVLDTLNRSLRGSESSDEDMSAYVKAADAVREAFTCAILVVHHCGINGERPRGHTSLTGAADAQLAVKRDDANNVVVTVECMKDGPEGTKLASALEVVDVGKDDDGEAITSCVVVPSDADAGSKAKGRVTGAAKVALSLLVRAIEDAGEVPPPSNHIPKGDIRAVTVETWRRYCYDGSISEGDSDGARKKAFARASQKLQAAELIGKWGDWVWLT